MAYYARYIDASGMIWAFNKPLFDTGTLYNAFGYEIEEAKS